MRPLYIHGIGTMAAGHDAAFSETMAALETLPIKEFVPPRKSRRFGRLSKMIYIAAAREIARAGIEDTTALPVINATCMGEAAASLGLLEQIHRTRGKTISPALVPNSVHNAPAGYLTIGLGNRAPSITVSQGWLSSEAAVAAASDWMSAGLSDRLLVLSGDEADPKWLDRLREEGADSFARGLEEEAFQEGAVAMVLGSAPSAFCLGRVIAGVERCMSEPVEIAHLLEKYEIRVGRDAEVCVRVGAKGEPLRHIAAKALNRPVGSIRVDGRGIGTAQAYALNRLAATVETPEADELLLLGGEVDEVAFLHWQR